MAQLGVDAITTIARGGEKPAVTPGLEFYDTGVALVTDKPVTGVESITSAEAAEDLLGLTTLDCQLVPVGLARRNQLAVRPRSTTATFFDVEHIISLRTPHHRISNTVIARHGGRSDHAAADTEIHSPKSAAEQFAQRSQSPVQRIQHVLHGHPSISPLLVLIIASIVFTIINPRLASPANLSLILQQVAVIAALAVGQTLIILTAGIDLSVGAITHPGDVGDGQPRGEQWRAGFPRAPHRLRRRHIVRVAQRCPDHPIEVATLHRHPGHAQHLHRARPAVLGW